MENSIMSGGLPLGELAAITVSFMWTFGTILFGIATKRVGAFSVNAIRILFAAVIFLFVHIIFFGGILPEANSLQWIYLSLSGIIGLTIGDFAYFGALAAIGPRRTVLLVSAAPIFSTITAFFILQEYLRLWALIGIGVTMTGVTLVLMESEDKTGEEPLSVQQKVKGIVLGLLAALGQGVGLVFSKYGMVSVSGKEGAELDPLHATYIRLLAATVSIWLIVLLKKKMELIKMAFQDRIALKTMSWATIIGPCLGIWLSMVAVTYTKAGIAATLMSLMPVIIIPILYMLYGQRTSTRSITGAFITVIGVAILFLR